MADQFQTTQEAQNEKIQLLNEGLALLIKDQEVKIDELTKN